MTVGVLHTGRSYPDDLMPDGIVYHYPRTKRPGQDAQEVSATKAAMELGLPVFVIVQPDSSSRRPRNAQSRLPRQRPDAGAARDHEVVDRTSTSATARRRAPVVLGEVLDSHLIHPDQG